MWKRGVEWSVEIKKDGMNERRRKEENRFGGGGIRFGGFFCCCKIGKSKKTKKREEKTGRQGGASWVGGGEFPLPSLGYVRYVRYVVSDK